MVSVFRFAWIFLLTLGCGQVIASEQDEVVQSASSRKILQEHLTDSFGNKNQNVSMESDDLASAKQSIALCYLGGENSGQNRERTWHSFRNNMYGISSLYENATVFVATTDRFKDAYIQLARKSFGPEWAKKIQILTFEVSRPPSSVSDKCVRSHSSHRLLRLCLRSAMKEEVRRGFNFTDILSVDSDFVFLHGADFRFLKGLTDSKIVKIMEVAFFPPNPSRTDRHLSATLACPRASCPEAYLSGEEVNANATEWCEVMMNPTKTPKHGLLLAHSLFPGTTLEANGRLRCGNLENYPNLNKICETENARDDISKPQEMNTHQNGPSFGRSTSASRSSDGHVSHSTNQISDSIGEIQLTNQTQKTEQTRNSNDPKDEHNKSTSIPTSVSSDQHVPKSKDAYPQRVIREVPLSTNQVGLTNRINSTKQMGSTDRKERQSEEKDVWTESNPWGETFATELKDLRDFMGGTKAEWRAAICYTGFLRSYRRAWDTHQKYLIRPLKAAGFNVSLFYATNPGVENRQETLGDFGAEMTEAELKILVAPEVLPGGQFFYRAFEADPTPDNGDATCKLSFQQRREQGLEDIGRFYGQIFRIRSCFQMVEEQEKAIGKKFDIVYRMRPDAVYLKPTNMKAIQNLLEVEDEAAGSNSKVVMLPPQSFITGGGVNDWAAVCRRENCPYYFNMVSLWEKCTSDPPGAKDPCCFAWGKFYNLAMEAQGWHTEDSVELFPITLLREKFLTCNRAKQFQELVENCSSLAKKWNVNKPFVCEKEGTVVVSTECPH